MSYETMQPDTPVQVVPVTPAQPTGNDLRAAILAKQDLKSEQLTVPEWGFTVEVREMRAKARQMLIQTTKTKEGTTDLVRFYPLVVINSTFDPATGMQIFQDADMDTLNAQGGTAMERIAQVASRLSGLNPADFNEAKNGSGGANAA